MALCRRYLVILAITLSQGCSRSAPDDLAPTATARAFFDALARSRWDSAAALADSEWLAEYRTREVAFIQSIALGRKMLAPDGVTIPGDTFDARFLRAFGSRRVPGLPGMGTFADLLQASPRKFLASCLAGAPSLTPSARWTRHVVGEVLETPDRAYVVYRHVGPGADHEPWTLPLVRRDWRWGYVLPRFADLPDCALVANVAGHGTH
jgi:hypothetical protein